VGRKPKRNSEVMTTLSIPRRLSDKIDKIRNRGETKAHALERVLFTYQEGTKDLREELKIKERIIQYYNSYCTENYREKQPHLDINAVTDKKLKVLKWIAQRINSVEDLGTNTNAYIEACAEELQMEQSKISEIVSEFYNFLELVAEQPHSPMETANSLSQSISQNSDTPLTAEEYCSLLFLYAMDHKNFLERYSRGKRDILSFGNNL
jgi:hypothetical protein